MNGERFDEQQTQRVTSPRWAPGRSQQSLAGNTWKSSRLPSAVVHEGHYLGGFRHATAVYDYDDDDPPAVVESEAQRHHGNQDHDGDQEGQEDAQHNVQGLRQASEMHAPLRQCPSECHGEARSAQVHDRRLKGNHDALPLLALLKLVRSVVGKDRRDRQEGDHQEVAWETLPGGPGDRTCELRPDQVVELGQQDLPAPPKICPWQVLHQRDDVVLRIPLAHLAVRRLAFPHVKVRRRTGLKVGDPARPHARDDGAEEALDHKDTQRQNSAVHIV
mmetsp:Transcript_5793/g.17237  ORF Transcript_5793/g.17237 Transcript_5793/m.17237 type:complete len:275 (+) Transcript_5793:57-881(+)